MHCILSEKGCFPFPEFYCRKYLMLSYCMWHDETYQSIKLHLKVFKIMKIMNDNKWDDCKMLCMQQFIIETLLSTLQSYSKVFNNLPSCSLCRIKNMMDDCIATNLWRRKGHVAYKSCASVRWDRFLQLLSSL